MHTFFFLPNFIMHPTLRWLTQKFFTYEDIQIIRGNYLISVPQHLNEFHLASFNDLFIVFISFNFLEAFYVVDYLSSLNRFFTSNAGMLYIPDFSSISLGTPSWSLPHVLLFFCLLISVLTVLNSDLRLLSIFPHILDYVILAHVFKYSIFAEDSHFNILICSPPSARITFTNVYSTSKWMSKWYTPNVTCMKQNS